MTYAAALRYSIERLDDAGNGSARREAEWMLEDVTGCSRAELYAYPSRKLAPEEKRRFERYLAQRASGVPLQYVTGWAYFYGMEFKVTRDVLIPRTETEVLVTHALKLISTMNSPRVLDVGTGSGCIAIALAAERKDAEVEACDISGAALGVARENAERLNTDVSFFLGDMEQGSPRLGKGRYDLVISNPPYIPDSEKSSLPAEVRDFEPETALFTGKKALHYYNLLEQRARVILHPGKWLTVEVHSPLATDVASLLLDRGWERVETHRDLTGRPRVVVGCRHA